MRDINYWLSKVPPLHANRPKFMAELAMLLQPLVDNRNLIEAMPSYFDIDQAIGVQLDAVGLWEGRVRNIPIPIQSCFFSLGDPVRGFGKGIWYNPSINPGVTYSSLDDDSFRSLLKAKAIANRWDGTVEMAQQVLDVFIPPGNGTFTFVQDNGLGTSNSSIGGMSGSSGVTIGISGSIPSIVYLEVLDQNLLSLKPAGVDTQVSITSVSGAPIFGLGVDNNYIGGLGHGAWAVSPAFILASDTSLIGL